MFFRIINSILLIIIFIILCLKVKVVIERSQFKVFNFSEIYDFGFAWWLLNSCQLRYFLWQFRKINFIIKCWLFLFWLILFIGTKISLVKASIIVISSLVFIIDLELTIVIYVQFLAFLDAILVLQLSILGFFFKRRVLFNSFICHLFFIFCRCCFLFFQNFDVNWFLLLGWFLSMDYRLLLWWILTYFFKASLGIFLWFNRHT